MRRMLELTGEQIHHVLTGSLRRIGCLHEGVKGTCISMLESLKDGIGRVLEHRLGIKLCKFRN